VSKLSVRRVGKSFGGLQALQGVSFETEGEILGLIGPNGAGKTTLFNIISGFLPPTTGEVYYAERSIHHYPAHQIVRLGIARTFQIVKPFADLTVLDNVLSGYGMPFYASWRVFSQRYHTPATEEKAHRILDLTGLTPWTAAQAGSLPIGVQRRLEIARALATEPSLLLLDEPAAGLTSHEAMELASLIRALYAAGKSIMVIEHNMVFAMGLCQRVIVLAQGEIISQGTPAQVQADERVISAYLGQE
jgi:branched-chain amino acid transport system ATP-binding protein